ncbi:hypothetical protein ABIB30_000631 [Pedobacter sp. UYP1]|jgi:hypothetical protein
MIVLAFFTGQVNVKIKILNDLKIKNNMQTELIISDRYML